MGEAVNQHSTDVAKNAIKHTRTNALLSINAHMYTIEIVEQCKIFKELH